MLLISKYQKAKEANSQNCLVILWIIPVSCSVFHPIILLISWQKFAKLPKNPPKTKPSSPIAAVQLTVLEVGGAEGLVRETISWMASRSLSRCRGLLMPISLWISVSDRADMMAPLFTLARHAATYQAGIPNHSWQGRRGEEEEEDVEFGWSEQFVLFFTINVRKKKLYLELKNKVLWEGYLIKQLLLWRDAFLSLGL